MTTRAEQSAQDAATLSASYRSLSEATSALNQLVTAIGQSGQAWAAWAENAEPAAVQAEGARYVAAVRELCAAGVPALDQALAAVAAGGGLPAPPSLAAAMGLEDLSKPTESL